MSTPTTDEVGGAPRRRVVVVDDNPGLLQMISELFVRADCDVAAFDHFESAKQYLKTNTPDIIVTDVRLGAFNGLHLVVLAKINHPETASVVMTGFDDPNIRAEALHAGAAFLIKPVSGDQVLAAVNAQLNSTPL